jgi:hypothetical protein
MAIPAIRRYERGERHHIQAQQIWQILAAFVVGATRRPSDRRTLTYGDLALAMGYDDPRAGHTLGRQLGIVGKYCLMNDLPCLNSIVVDKTGVPGESVLITPGRTLEQEHKQVFNTRWHEYRRPTTGTLRQVGEAFPGHLGDELAKLCHRFLCPAEPPTETPDRVVLLLRRRPRMRRSAA